MQAYFRFLWLWIKKAFSQSLGMADLLSGLGVSGLAFLAHFNPKISLDMDILSWLVPLTFFGAVFTARLFIAPYLLWKEQNEKLLQSLNNTGALQIGFYSKQVSFLYNDLIENWSEEGISAHMLELRPRSVTGYFCLEEIAPSMLLSEQTRKNLNEFLSYFLVNKTIFATTFPAIKTIFTCKEDVLKQKKKLKSLAEKLSADLKNIEMPKKEG